MTTRATCTTPASLVTRETPASLASRATTLCFSGHRYYSEAATDEARLFAALQAAYADGYRTFISGVAEGFDLFAAEAVVRLHTHFPDVRLVCAVPFARQSAKYSADDHARYDALLEAADRVHVLSERYSYGCYYRRDDWMVDRSARIVCWFDGSGNSARSVGSRDSGNSRGSGGTRYTVRRALTAGLEIVNLFRDPDTLF